jgi:hypothetical protein
MDDYNALISAKILDGYEGMIDTVPQPQMLGGKRMRNFVLPASTEYDYPGTLSVGTTDGKYAQTLGGAFFRDFNKGFPMEDLAGGASHCEMEGGAYYIGADGKVHSSGQIPIGMPRRVGGRVPKALRDIGKVAVPVAKDLGMTLAKEGIKEGVKSYAKSGGRVPKALRDVGKVAMPIAKDLGMTLAKEGIKEGVKSYAKSGGRRRRKSNILKSVGKVMGSVGRELVPVAKDVFHDVIVPEGKKALRDYIRASLKAKPSEASDETAVGKGRKPRMTKKMMMGADPSTYTPQHLLAEGGVLIRNEPGEFHSSVYPPALASYAHSFPKGKDAFGRGRDPAKPKRSNARGAIVKEVMSKYGLSLPEASKFVKEKGLY